MTVLNRHDGERLTSSVTGASPDYLFRLHTSDGFTGTCVLYVETNAYQTLRYETYSKAYELLDEDSEPLHPDFFCDSVDTVFNSIIIFHKDFLDDWSITVDPESLPVVEVLELPPDF